MVNPVRLPCGHVFCYLCAKGHAGKARVCGLCRSDVGLSYFNSPVLGGA